MKKAIVCGLVLITSLLLVRAAHAHHDPIHSLSDEFNNASTINNWQRIYQTEGWVANQLEAWLVDDARAPGQMLFMPHSSGWYQNMRGALVYKQITGDFIATTHLTVYSRHDRVDPISDPNTEAPNRTFSLAGIMVRSPTNVIQAAPQPYSEEPHPVGFGGSDWAANLDNYIFLSYGVGDPAGQRHYEVKSTINGTSELYYRNRGVADTGEVWLQAVRVGDTLLVLRRHSGGDWVIENRFIRNDFADTLQVGITTYTDWDRIGSFDNSIAESFHHNYIVVDDAAANPDLIAHVDYFRLERPSAALSELLLQSVSLDFTAGGVATGTVPLALLSGSVVASYLGDNANTPLPEALIDSAFCFPVRGANQRFSVVCL